MTVDLILDGISKTYEGATGVAAVNGVSLEVEKGEFLTLLGPSGCGKTTLLRIIGGFVAPSTGRVSVRGQDVTSLPPQKRPTAMVFQNYALFPHMTAADNVAFGLKVRRLPKEEMRRRVARSLEIVNLSQAGERYPHQLSGGQQQRIALARALAVEPPVLLMDEPLGALDAKLREEMQYELCAIQRRLGITTIYVTHDQEEAFNMSDRVAVMNQGRVLQIGSSEDIYHRPNSAFVATFVGRSNILRGSVCASTGTTLTIGGRGFAATIPPGFRPNDAVVVIIRPESVFLGGTAGADSYAEGTVERRRIIGGSELYYIRVDPELVMLVEDRTGKALGAGDPARITWHSSQSIVLPDLSCEETMTNAAVLE